MTYDTKTEILNSAQRLTALKGFDAFSYRDIAAEVDIKTSSIHYYFPSKSDLALELVQRYTDTLSASLADLSANGQSGYDQIKTLFSRLCSASGSERNFCLCGMLSADVHTITEAAKDKLNSFFSLLETWIGKTLKNGIKDGSIHSAIKPKSSAIEITALFEGAMLIARVRNSDTYLNDTLNITLSRLRA